MDAEPKILPWDAYIGRGNEQFGRSEWANTHRWTEIGREASVTKCPEGLRWDHEKLLSIPNLGGRRLRCHSRTDQSCHGDALIQAFKEWKGSWTGPKRTLTRTPSSRINADGGGRSYRTLALPS